MSDETLRPELADSTSIDGSMHAESSATNLSTANRRDMWWYGIILILLLVCVGAWLAYSNLSSESPKQEVSAERKIAQACKQLIAGNEVHGDVPLPITCELIVNKNEPALSMTILPDGSVKFARDGVILSEFRNDTYEPELDSDSIVSIVSYYDDKVILDFEPFYLNDFNYDGYLDIVMLAGRGAYQASYKLFAYNTKSHTFDTKPTLELTDPVIDEKTKEIYSHAKGRGLNDIYSNETYRFEKGEYVLVRLETQDMVDFNDLDSDYVYIEYERKNGEMLEVKREIITASEIFGEQ
ncbi:MAG: hypothetical protein AB203_02720 [Parcubacteria bacterium C7867-008]|nr:MAG: hypothetical protein AB203_02720 [Parcubacteria bacterium C7867-008]